MKLFFHKLWRKLRRTTYSLLQKGLVCTVTKTTVTERNALQLSQPWLVTNTGQQTHQREEQLLLGKLGWTKKIRFENLAVYISFLTLVDIRLQPTYRRFLICKRLWENLTIEVSTKGNHSTSASMSQHLQRENSKQKIVGFMGPRNVQ